MSDQNSSVDSLSMNEFEKPKLPTGLNVLTILTFIGCGIQLFSTVNNFIGAQKAYDERETVITQMNSPEMPSFMKNIMPSAENLEIIFTKSYENRIPLFIIGLVATILCVYGAIEMRKLKKQGFTFYTIGQLLPYLSTLLFIGAVAYSGTLMVIFSFIGLLFLVMYFFQRKHLVY